MVVCATFGGLGVAGLAGAALTVENKGKRMIWGFGIASVVRRYHVGAGRTGADGRYKMWDFRRIG